MRLSLSPTRPLSSHDSRTALLPRRSTAPVPCCEDDHPISPRRTPPLTPSHQHDGLGPRRAGAGPQASSFSPLRQPSETGMPPGLGVLCTYSQTQTVCVPRGQPSAHCSLGTPRLRKYAAARLDTDMARLAGHRRSVPAACSAKKSPPLRPRPCRRQTAGARFTPEIPAPPGNVTTIRVCTVISWPLGRGARWQKRGFSIYSARG